MNAFSWRRSSWEIAAAEKPRLWLLLGKHAGDNNQLLALAEALGWPYEPKQLRYNRLRHVPLMRRGLKIVRADDRGELSPPWPDLVIGTGYGSVPVARYIRQQSGGRAKLVHVGNPREELDDFDLQITTPQYSRGPAPNLLELPFPIGNPARATRASFEELAWLRELARPLRLIAVGGPARHWALDHKTLRKALETLRSKHPSGGIVIATSPRTGSSTRKFLANTADAGEPIIERFPRFPVLLAEADEIYVTADSVSMISEAVLTGKPVGIVPIKRSHSGRAADLLYERPTGKAAFPDFRNFWAMLERRELVGTVELPVASQVCDTVERAADAVRSLFGPGDWVDEGKPSCTASDLGASRRARGR